MSNYMSQEYRITNPVSSVDLQVVDNTLSTLQKKYDTNTALIDQTLAYYNENLKGIRTEDNQYIAEKLKRVKSTIDEYKKKNVNLAYNYNRDSIMSAVKETLNDPIVKDAIVSRQNYMNYQSQIAKIKEKDSSKYSVQNEQFGLAQGGFDAYMQGKTKVLGSMQYTEYIDLPAEHSKRLQEYVKNYDDEQYLGTQAHGGSPYHTVDIYGKRVLKSDLKKFLETSMDGKERNQLSIDAWYNFKNVDDKSIASFVKPKYEQDLAELKRQKVEYQASVASGKEKEDKTLTNALDEKISKLSSKVNSNLFDRNDAYNTYSENYIDNMADAFDKNVITKKDIDDTGFQLMKFQVEDKRWALNYQQKEREIALKNKEVSLIEQQSLGTKVEVPTGSEDQGDKTEFEKSLSARRGLYQEIEAELNQTNPLVGKVPFSELSEKEKINYINTLDFSDKTRVKGDFSKDLVNKVQDYNQIRKTHVDTYEKTIKSFQNVAISSFQDMQAEYFKPGNDLKIDNVASYAPTLAGVIKNAKKNGRQLSWADIPTDSKYAIQAELLNAHTGKNKGNLSADQLLINKTASYLMTSKIKDKNILNSVNQASKTLDDVGYFENAGNFFNNLWEEVKYKGKMVGTLGTLFKEGVDAASEEMQNIRAEKVKNLEKVNYLDIVPQAYAIRNTYGRIIQEEEDLDNIEARDLGGRLNIGTRFRNAQSAINQTTMSNYDNMSPNLKSSYAYAFSTENKAQKPTADLIRQLVLTNEEVQSGAKDIPNATNNFTITPSGEGYSVNYIAKGDKENEITSVYFAKLPEALQGMVDKTKDNWNRSVYNPSLQFEDINFRPIGTHEEAENIIKNVKRYGSGIPNDPFIVDIERGIFKPSIEYVRQDVSEDVYQKFKSQIDKFLSQNFSVKTRVDETSNMMISDIYYTNIKDGQKAVKTIPHIGLIEKDDIYMQLNIATEVDILKKQALKSLK